MRIKIVHSPVLDEIDGIDLKRFAPGFIYDVGNSLGAVLLSEGWAEPVPDDIPALVVPFSDNDPFVTRVVNDHPPNLRREIHPPYLDETAVADDLDRRRRPRPRKR